MGNRHVTFDQSLVGFVLFEIHIPADHTWFDRGFIEEATGYGIKYGTGGHPDGIECPWKSKGVEDNNDSEEYRNQEYIRSARSGVGGSQKHVSNRSTGRHRYHYPVPRSKNGELATVGTSIVSRNLPLIMESDSPEVTSFSIFSSILRRIALQSSTSFAAPIFL